MNQLRATQGISHFKYLHKYSTQHNLFIPVTGQKSIWIKSDLFLIFSQQKCCLQCKDKTRKLELTELMLICHNVLSCLSFKAIVKMS